MGLFSKIKDNKQHSEAQADTFSAGDEVYVTTSTEVYQGTIVQKDESGYHLSLSDHYIVNVPRAKRLMTLPVSMLTKVNDLPTEGLQNQEKVISRRKNRGQEEGK